MKIYRASRGVLAFYGAVFMCVFAAAIFVVWVTARDPSQEPPSVWFILVWFGFIVWSGYSLVQTAFEVKIGEDNQLEFRGLLGRTVVAGNGIESITGPALGVQYVEFKHTHGKIRMVQPIEGLYELISTLKSLNPSIKVKRL